MLKSAVDVGWLFSGGSMSRLASEAGPPICAPDSVDLTDTFCEMEMSFRSANGNRPAPLIKKRSCRGARKRRGRTRQLRILFFELLAAQTGVASTLQPFSASSAKHWLSRSTQTEWECVWKELS